MYRDQIETIKQAYINLAHISVDLEHTCRDPEDRDIIHGDLKEAADCLESLTRFLTASDKHDKRYGGAS